MTHDPALIVLSESMSDALEGADIIPENRVARIAIYERAGIVLDDRDHSEVETADDLAYSAILISRLS